MDGSGGLDLSGSHDNDEAYLLSLLDFINWELDSESVLDPFDKVTVAGNQVASVPSINSQSHDFQGASVPSINSQSHDYFQVASVPSINSQSDELLGIDVDDFMDDILLEELNRRSPPPAASRSVVKRLTKLVMKGNTDEVCVICHEDAKKDEKMYKLLPCLHYYHGNCIKQWLKLRNTCPVCRFELPSEKDPKTF